MDPNLLGWAAASATGAAFMFLLRWVLAHVESDLTHARKAANRGVDLAEKAVIEDAG